MPAAWGSWLSCEETLEAAGATGAEKDHGYVFEVPIDTVPGRPAAPIPLKQLGRMAHEAAAESPGIHELDFPDNIAVSPRGGIIICEDGTGAQFLRGLTPSGNIFNFARNIHNTLEFAGACFSPDGQTMFVNLFGRDTARTITPLGVTVQYVVGPELHEKAMTLAIWGPWGSGLL